MNESTFAELASGYALSALSPSDRQAFETALAQHPEWEKHVRTEADIVMRLADSVEPVTPPAFIRDSLLERIARTPQTIDASSQPGAPSAQSSPGEAAAIISPAGGTSAAPVKRRWFALAASVAVLLALGFGAVTVAQQLTRPVAVVALEQIQDAPDAQSATVSIEDGGEATAHWSPSLGDAVLVSDGLPALASDRTFELWLVRDGAAITAGTFTPDSTTVLAGDFEPGDVLAVTIEPAGGAPGGVPSGAPILAIETA